MMNANWSRYPNFSKSEFDCQETGENEMKHEFMKKLQDLRAIYGKAMTISSGYRSPRHSIEAKKEKPGSHSTGMAADIAVSGKDAYKIVKLAIELDFTGIGINQKGGGRFIHLDIADENKFSRPNIWSY